MKKYLLGIVAMVMAIGFSAFTVQQQAPVKDSPGPVYEWHRYNPAGTAELFPVVAVEGDEAFARQQFNCPSGNIIICARAYELDGTPTSVYILKP